MAGRGTRRRKAESRPSGRARAARCGGETLVECLVAVALVAMVAIPALSAMRGALATASGAANRAAAASTARIRARSAAARLRFDDDVPPISVSEAPVRVICRVVELQPESPLDPPQRRACAESPGAPDITIEALPPLRAKTATLGLRPAGGSYVPNAGQRMGG